jgi:hypothetical protein
MNNLDKQLNPKNKDMEEGIVKRKLSSRIKRTNLRGWMCDYQYNFSTNQWLESVDNMEYFGISHNDLKQKLIDSLVDEFRISLNAVVFDDPAGRTYVEYLEKQSKK